MEFDNDRLVRGTYKAEIFCWIFFALINPLTGSLGVFPHRAVIWPVLLLISVFLLPLYLLYSRVVVPKYLFTKKNAAFAAITALFFAVLLSTIFFLDRLAISVVPDDAENYFSYSAANLARESSWVIINSCFAVAIAYLRKRLDEDDTIDLLKKNNTFYKLRYFRSQLKPHFLFNTLNSIYSLSLNKADKTPEVVIRLSDIMRFLIYECNEDKIPIEKEIEFIRNYIEIEKIRYDADIQFAIEGNTEGIMIQPFLFISFIENGFKHAIDTSFGRPFIYITLKINEQQIALNVINNTNPELETPAARLPGKGIENSKSILELLYPDAYSLEIIQTEKGERKESKQRLRNAKERLHRLYPDSNILDIILSNNTFTVSLILLDKMHNYRR